MKRSADERPIRLLFLAWGYSIHAERRIRIFCEDPRFEVCVVSTHNYGFRNALNIDLTAAVRAGRSRADAAGRGETEADTCSSSVSLRDRFFNNLLVRFVLDSITAARDLMILLRVVKRFQPDVVFLQTLMYPCYLSYFLPRSLPVVVTFWNGDVTWWAKWNGIERILKRWIVSYGAKRAQQVTVNSEAAQRACLQYGIAEEHIHLIRYPGVDLGRFRVLPKQEARTVLGIAQGHVVLAPRGLGGYLNSEVIVEAAPLVIRHMPDILFIFLWNVDQAAELNQHKKRAAELGIADHVRWDSRVAWDRMPAYYAAADVMVSLSWNDSLPNCMMESMACEVPVLMGDIPAVREWITDGMNGCLVDPKDSRIVADAIIRIIRDPEQKNATLVSNGLDLVRSKADSSKNGELIKELVLRAGRAGDDPDKAGGNA